MWKAKHEHLFANNKFPPAVKVGADASGCMQCDFPTKLCCVMCSSFEMANSLSVKCQHLCKNHKVGVPTVKILALMKPCHQHFLKMLSNEYAESTIRKGNEDCWTKWQVQRRVFPMFVFYYIESHTHQHPVCVICNKVVSKPSLLQWHFAFKHKDHKTKQLLFFCQE